MNLSINRERKYMELRYFDFINLLGEDLHTRPVDIVKFQDEIYKKWASRNKSFDRPYDIFISECILALNQVVRGHDEQ